jgi:ADP-ribose pyrophosphatase YjhB (NUDIX family)
MKPKARLEPVVKWLVVHWGLVTRAKTLGVRVAAFNEAGHVFLVKHSYVPGWYLPGGGVDGGETCLGAAVRELDEEAALAPTEPLSLFAVYRNARITPRDHVMLYVTRNVRTLGPLNVPNREIIAAGFFDPAALPEDATDATRRRLAEVLGGEPPTEDW